MSDLREKVPPVLTPPDEEPREKGMGNIATQIDLEMFLKKIKIFHFLEKACSLFLAKGQKLHGPKLGGSQPGP